jgi:hypothetical protein
MKQLARARNSRFGMNLNAGTDQRGIVHKVRATAVSVADITGSLHGRERELTERHVRRVPWSANAPGRSSASARSQAPPGGGTPIDSVAHLSGLEKTFDRLLSCTLDRRNPPGRGTELHRARKHIGRPEINSPKTDAASSGGPLSQIFIKGKND